MIYVGINIAKLNHYASAISSDGVELMKPFEFTNDSDGFQMLNSRLMKTTASSVLNRRHTTAKTLLPVTTICVLNPIKTSVM